MAAPEVYLGPCEVYVAPVGEAFPAVNVAPSGNWTLVGKHGSRNYTEDGVVVRRPTTAEQIGALGTTMTRKVGISRTGFEVEFTVMDMEPDAMVLAFGGEESTITDTAQSAGVAGNEAFPMPTSPIPLERAILLRWGRSPFGAAFNSQIEVAVASQIGAAEGTFSKSNPFGLRQHWVAIEPVSGPAVTVRVQKTAPGAE